MVLSPLNRFFNLMSDLFETPFNIILKSKTRSHKGPEIFMLYDKILYTFVIFMSAT
jgi:hypothetical protein